MSAVESLARPTINPSTSTENAGLSSAEAKQRARQERKAGGASRAAAGGEPQAAGGATAPTAPDRPGLTPRGAEKAGISLPHDDPRFQERAGSRQLPKREQAIAAPEITEDQGIVVSRSELVHGVTTGESMKMQRMLRESPIKFLGIPIEDRRKLETGEAVFIEPQIARKAEEFLRTYVRSWNELAKLDAPAGSGAGNLYEYIIDNPAYAADKAILDKLSKADGTHARGVVDEKGFRDFLSNSSSWGELALAIDRFTILAEVGTGMQTVINNPIYNKPRNEDFDRAKVILADDLKSLRMMMKSGTSNAASIAGAIAYYGFGGRATTEADMRHLAEIVTEAKANLSIEDRAVFKALARIDIDNIDVVGGRVVMLNNSPSYIESLKQEISQGMNLKTDLKVSLGLGEYPTYGWFTKFRNVKRYTPDMLQTDLYREEQGFAARNGGGTPDGSRFITDVQTRDEYSRLVRESIAATGADPSPFERRVMLMQAVEIVGTRWATTRLDREGRQREEAQEADSLKALDEKQTAMESGEFRKERIDRALDSKNKAEAAKTSAEERRTALNSLSEKETAFSQRQAELLSAEFGVAYAGGDIDAAVQTRINAIEGVAGGPIGEINTLLGTVVAGPLPLGYAGTGELRNIISYKEQQIRTEQAALRDAWRRGNRGARTPAPFPQEQADAIRATYEAQYAAQYAEIGRLNDLKEQLAGLKAKHKEFGIARRELEDAVLKIRANSSERNPVSQAQAAHARLLVAPPGLTPDEINNLTAQQIGERLAGVAGGPFPWGTTDADRRSYALRAKTGEEMDQNVTLPINQDTALNWVNTLGTPINSDDALRMTQQDFVNAIIAAGGVPAAGVPPGIPAGSTADEVARWAREGAVTQRRAYEYASINQDVQNAQADIRAADEQLNNLRNLEVPRAQVEVARAVMRRAMDDSLYSETRSIVDIPQGGMGSREDRLVTELANVNPIIAAGSRVTQAETDAGFVQGLSEWYAYLYPGFKDATNRQELFEGFMRSLPPRRLAEIIGAEIGYIPATADNQVYVRRVLTRFGARASGARLPEPRPTQAQMLRIVRTMVSEIREAAGAV